MKPKKDIIVKDSGLPWYTTTIMVWVHGNELAGPKALEDIIDDVKIISGKVNFIFANLKALELNQRYYEKNMNRCFIKNNWWESYEECRVQEIMKYLDESDYLLDCHNTENKDESVPMIIGENFEYAQFFDIPVMISWLDAIQPGSSDGYMFRSAKVGICIETWNIMDAEWPKRARKAIINFLKATKNISWTPEIYNTENYYHIDTPYITSTNFKLHKIFSDLESVQKWSPIGSDGETPIIAQYDGVLLFSHNRFGPWEEAFYMGKEIVIKK